MKKIISEDFIGGSTSVILTQQVDPNVLGGLALTVGTQYVDLTVKSQLDEIFEAYNNAINAEHEKLMQRIV